MSTKFSKKGKVKIFCSFQTSPNIALIKYWGKMDESEIIPLNSSMGVTLDQQDLKTVSKLTLSNKYEEDQIILNGKEHKINDRVFKILKFFRTQKKNILETYYLDGNQIKDIVNVNQLKIKLKSKNDFPTASGLASSSSGLAALSVCLCELFQYHENVSQIARLGSGSACRSVFGGLVEWEGPQVDYVKKFYELQNKQQNLEKEIIQKLSQECQSKSLYPKETFENFEILILCDSFNEKEVPSTLGMLQSTQNSELLRARVLGLVQERIKNIKLALEKKDFNEVMMLTMQDSNQFHATCLDTIPPIFYLNEFSKSVINMVNHFNSDSQGKVGYTYDAGPHSVLLIPSQVFPHFFQILATVFEFKKIELNQRGQQTLNKLSDYFKSTQQELNQYFQIKVRNPCYVIHTKVGDGPLKIE